MTDFIKPRKRLTEDPRGHFLCQAGSLGVNIMLSELDKGIVNMIEQFGSRLYYGYPNKHVFLNHWYLQKRYSLIKRMQVFDLRDETLSKVDINDMALYLYMTRIAQSQEWKYPALLTRMPDGAINQTTGGTRAFATGLTKSEPWKHFPVLLLERNDINPDQMLDNPVRITSDRQLTEILGGVYDKEIWDPTIRMVLEITKDISGNSYCLLKFVDDFVNYSLATNRGQDFLQEFQQWRSLYPGRPKLKIYTNYPQNIRDINGVWDWEVVAGTGNFETMMGTRVGWIEKLARDYHIETSTRGGDHALWLIKDRLVDLGDLLPWMDVENTTYISSDWSFACYRPDAVFKSTFVDVSYQE